AALSGRGGRGARQSTGSARGVPARARPVPAGAVAADRAQPPGARNRRSRRRARRDSTRARPPGGRGEPARSVLGLSLLSGTASRRSPRRAVSAVPAESAVKTLAATVAVMLAAQSNFSTRREVVRVDVLVIDRGQPVPGLTTADFELFDNGVAQRVDLVSHEDIPLNVVLAFDTSGSVTAERLGHLRDAGYAVLKGLTKHDQAGLVTFSHVVAQ